MIDKHKRSIPWRFIFALLFSGAIMALVFFVAPTFTPTRVLGGYTHHDSATGLGTPIKDKGNWFMYNEYDGGTVTYDIQAGNPKDGQNINKVGTYTVTPNLDGSGNPDGTFTVNYTLDNGIHEVDSHLAISDAQNFTGKPGQDANASFETPITAPSDGPVYIFVHFSIEY